MKQNSIKDETVRAEVLQRVISRQLPLKDAALILHISYRQASRLLARFEDKGLEGLVHGLSGKPSNHACDPQFKQSILDIYRKLYPDFGPTFAAEKLAESGLEIDHETLRLWLLEEKLWSPHRKSSLHRSWRERRAHFGELIQIDGSPHAWFEDRAPRCCLMNCVDDATGVTLALMSQEETIEAAMTVVWKWIESFGIPAAFYSDRKNVYFPPDKKALGAYLADEERLTHFGRACQKLGIAMIKAHSPQAKGRVERNNQTHQDRLVKELRLAGISDIPSANEFLYGGYLEKHNDKFAVEPREEQDYHRSKDGVDLSAIFCLEEERSITKDWIVRYENDYYQLKKLSGYGPAEGKVLVRKYLNEEVHFNYRGEEIAYHKLAQKPVRVEKRVPPKEMKKRYSPSPDHPWRKSWK